MKTNDYQPTEGAVTMHSTTNNNHSNINDEYDIDQDDGMQDLGLPVSVQTFLWRQIAPFIRPKLGKLHETSCMFCQHAPGHHESKEACKSFEKVLVQNIQFGLSPPLTKALGAIPRWRLLQAALPHVMHCVAAVLHNRVKDMQAIGAVETKLLYTMQWILLYAAEECVDDEVESTDEILSDGGDNKTKLIEQYLFSVPTITLFVYLFAPIIHHLKESDFQNFRLENGIKLWQGMWDNRAPGAPCFTTPVKPKARNLLCAPTPKGSTDIYSARKQSSDADALSPTSPQSGGSEQTIRQDEEGSWISSPKEFAFPETIPEEASSVEDERVVIFRLPSASHLMDNSFFTADASLLQQQQPQSRRGSRQSVHSRDKDKPATKFEFEQQELMRGASIKEKRSASVDKETDSNRSSTYKADISAATFLDVAVMRCLFISHWQEEGIFWSLQYLYNRLSEIGEDAAITINQPRKRSNSLPIPQIEISLYQGPGSNNRDSPGSSIIKNYIEIPEAPTTIGTTEDESPTAERRGSEKKKRVKMSDLRAFVETKMFSKSEKNLEKIGLDTSSANGKISLQHAEYHRSLDTGEKKLSRSASMISREPSSNLIKGKSMPSLSCLLDSGYVEPSKAMRPLHICSQRTTFYPRNPIITVTEHTPTPSPDYLKRQGSIDSQLDALSNGGSIGGGATGNGVNGSTTVVPGSGSIGSRFKSHMLRSHTDSHIDYTGVDESEAPGSSFYITPEGGLDYEIILLAVYNVFKRDLTVVSLRVLEAGLNICELLLEIGVLKLGEHAHEISMGIIKRALLLLGCPHGCKEGVRGPPADFLRNQCQKILARLLRHATHRTKRHLHQMVQTAPLQELVDFLHGFCAFCVDPSSLLSPLTHKRTSGFKNPNTDLGNGVSSSGGQGGYSTNFGGGLGGGPEPQLIEAMFKPLVTRFVDAAKDFKTIENAQLYGDIRQLVTYVKGAHGGSFRLVALSGILAVTPRPHKKGPISQTTRVIRHIPQAEVAQSVQNDDNRSQRRILLKKRSTSSACAVSLLETEPGDEHYKSSQSPLSNFRRRTTAVRPTLTPRHSERALLSDSTSSSERNSLGRLSGLVRWFKGAPKESSSIDLEIGSLNPEISSTFVRHASLKIQRGRSSDGIGRSIQRAKRRVERRLNRFGGIVKGKKKSGGIEETADYSRRSSSDMCDGPRESEVVVLKERKLIPLEPVRLGMLRLSFLLETVAPGSFPDPQLVAAVLDLPQAPLVARATFLLECAHFVHLCNKGQWPIWMKQNTSTYRPSGANISANQMKHQISSTSTRRQHILHRAAGKMFHQWAEMLGARLEEILFTERLQYETINVALNDPEKQRELLQQDEEEDFLDESSVNPHGNDCPHALKLIACILLFEITTYLRDVYVHLPKTSKLLHKEKPAPWEKVYREANRRWSMALSSMGHSQTSAQSLQSIAAGNEAAGQPERKISFVLHEPDNESENSSNTTLTKEGEEARRPTASAVRPYLLRRGTATTTGGSFKRRSLKLRRNTKDSKDMEADFKRVDSIQSRRKVSSLSDRSDTSEQGVASGGEDEHGSPGILSDDQQPESPTDSNETDDTAKNMPWLKAIIGLITSYNYYCSHKGFCHPYCHKRHMRACVRLIKATRKVYGEDFGFTFDSDHPNLEQNTVFSTKNQQTRTRSGRKVSEQSSTQTSPSKRKDSLTRKDRISDDPDLEIADKVAKAFRKEKEKKDSEEMPILKFIRFHVRSLFHYPFATMLKGAVILTEEMIIEAMPAAWELLLETNQDTATTSAAVFLMGSVKAQNFAFDIMQRALKNKDPDIRIRAIQRYLVLWKNRFHFWPRLEGNAHDVTFKVPPGGIEFTLPSPKIGIESLPVVDPPWTPEKQTKDMDVTLNQDRHVGYKVTATKSRKMQQTEAIRNALRQQRDKQRAERHSFFITTIPVNQQASHEPGMEHEDHEAEEEIDGGRASSHLHYAHSLFPSVLCSSVMQIVGCLDDAAIGSDGNAVYEVAYQVIWICLVEESALFLRYVFERLTRDRQDQMFKLLRHLIRFVPRLPQQAAFALYNSIIGYIMFYVRSSNELKQELVGSALSVLWMVVHSVHGIMFKDLKQILRKEQCDASILLTANVPAAKKIVVHGPFDDDCNIPSQFPVQEDTLFLQLLKESLDYYSVEEKNINNYCLIDYKSNKILNPNWYIRDLYFFKRSQYPEVRLILMKPEESFLALQKQELTKKFVEIGKVHLTWAILKNVDMVVQRVVFLHEELMKLPSFPRKALEVDLDLHQGGEYGKVLLGLDVLHKFMWVRLIARMFEAMAGNFAYSADIQLFLNVLSGAAFLHAEDSCIMRYVMATYINAAFNFKNIFSTNGYFMIMPTLLQIYSLYQTNKLITTTIEYAVKQFYLLNRKPFILQMFGSVSAILDTDEEGTYGEAHKVQSSCLFNLLLSLEDPSPDPLNIAELVKEPKPLKAIDFCYHDEDGDVTVLDCITLCVMVVSYSAESNRGYQMLIILEAILPCYLQQIQSPSYIPLQGKSERDIILQLAVAIRTMVHNCEGLAKSYNGPYRNSPEHKGSSQRNCSRGPPCSPGLDFEDESHSKYATDPRAKNIMDTGEDSEMIRTEYRRPRDVLLSVVGDFLSKSTTRLIELAKKLPNDAKPTEVLDAKCHIRLAEIAHSLLKVSPYDPESMACRGLQRYMQAILPRAEWSNDALRNALVTILRRIDKVFLKISKKPSIRRNTDWEAAAGLLKGIHETIVKHPYILHWQQMKTLISTVQNLIVNEPGSAPEGVSSAGAALMSRNPPAFFCSTVVRLVALQVVSPVDCFSLAQICGGSAEFATQEKAEGYLMHLIMPLCLKVCSGRGVSEVGELKMSDVTYLLNAVLNAMSPPAGRTGQAVAQINRVGGDLRAGSLTFTGSRDAKRPARIAGSLYQAAFLALRIVCICFENRLSAEWPRIVRVMRDLGRRNEAAPDLWSFLEFVVTHRTPLYIVLMPFILHKISQPPIGDHERHMQFIIRERLRGTPPQGGIKSKGALLLELARELRDLREELEEKRYDRESSDQKKTDAAPISTTTDGHNKAQQRPSLISIFTGTTTGQATHSHVSAVPVDSRSGSGGIYTPSDTLSQQTLHPPRESLSSSSTGRDAHTTTSESQSGEQTAASAPTLIGHTVTGGTSGSTCVGSSQGTSAATITTAQPVGQIAQLSHSQSLQQAPFKAQPPKLRFVSSVEFRHSSGETSTTPLSPESPAEDSSGDHTRSRLQRSKAASRKTFRMKRNRLTPMETPNIVTSQEEHPKTIGEISWDSVSQTSSTSGYRDTNSLQTGLLSPDGSLGGMTLGRSPSQHSLLMVYEGQDEDTLI